MTDWINIKSNKMITRKIILDKIKNIFLSIEQTNKLSKNTNSDNKYEIWEVFWLHILNIIYWWKLENLNVKYSRNFSWIDLWDENKNIWVQVTVTNNDTHIKSTLEKYFSWKEKRLKEQYFNLYFFFISSVDDSSKNYSFNIEDNWFNFSNKRIITFNSLLKLIEIKKINELEEILFSLEEYENKEIKDYFKELLRSDDYKLAKKIIKENKEEFYENNTFIEISKEFKKIGNSEINWNNKFNYDFEKFSETYKIILINIKRLKKSGHTENEKLEFYKNIINNNNYILHFFDNLWKIKNDLFDEIIEKTVFEIIDKNYSYKSVLVILIFLEKYLNKNNEEKILQVFINILEKSKEEFISRKIAIILAKQKLNFINSALVLEVLKWDIKKSQNWFASDFILEFLGKNIDRFNKFEIEEIIKLFNFEKEGKNEFININSHWLRQEKYLWKIISKILKIDYKLAFLFFWKLIELEEWWENKDFNWIKYIPFFKFPESNLEKKKSYNNSDNFNIFVDIALELIKLSNSKNDRKLFEEIIKYIIEEWEYSIYYELISFVLIKNRTKNFKLIEKLVKKKEILWFINFFQERWAVKIYKYYLNKDIKYIKTFRKNILSKKIEITWDKEYLQIWFLKVIPNKYLTKEEIKYIFKYEEKNYKVNFKDEDSFKITTSVWRWKALITRFENNEKIEEICKKIDTIFEKENSFDYWDYKSEFNKYFKNNLLQIKEVYKYISKQNKEEKYILASHLISTKIEIWKEKYKDKMNLTFYIDLINIYNILDEEDNNSKIMIGQLLDDNWFLRNDEFTWKIKEKDNKIYSWLKNIVINLANNKTILEDSDNDWLMLWLNTAKWLGVINCSLLFYFYPYDKELKDKIIELSYDKLYWIHATLISNMSLFLWNNYRLVDDVLSRYILEQNKSRDYAIVNYFFWWRISWYWDYKKLYIKIFNYLLNSKESKVQNTLWEILGIIIFSWIMHEKKDIIKEYLVLLENIIQWKKWNQNSMLWFCFAIQKNFLLWNDEEFEILINILENYKDKKSDWKIDSIYYRLSFLFYSDTLTLDLFDNFYDKWIFELLIEKSKESWVFSNINKYLYKILKNKWKENIDKIINILKLETDNWKNIFDEHSFNWIHKLIKEIFDNFDWKNNKICNEIFEKWLESWNKIYLELFNKYYKE